MKISLIDLINLINLINVLINLAPDSLAPMQISLLADSLAPVQISLLPDSLATAAFWIVLFLNWCEIKPPFYNMAYKCHF